MKGGDKMNEPMVGKEAHKIKRIENLMCQLANDVDNLLAKAKEINSFFFGIPMDGAKPLSEEVLAPTGWFDQNIDVIEKINTRVLDATVALANIHEVVSKK